MNYSLPDITNEEDVKRLVNIFYDKIYADTLLAPIFNEQAKVNWEKHLPIMYRFWSSILLGTATYSGQPFPKHAFLPVTEIHFNQWLLLFEETLQENFNGPVAEEAKLRAINIARIFLNKINIIQGREVIIPVLNNH